LNRPGDNLTDRDLDNLLADEEASMTNDSIEFRTRLALEEAQRRGRQQDLERARLETTIAFGRKSPLTAEDKFRMLKSFGSRDSFDP
jgi:hypothetical protein